MMPITQSLPLAGSIHPSPSHEIDVELFTFIERYATNLARWDLLLFFGQNPFAHDAASNIAQQIGRPERAVLKELEDLAYLGVLRADCDDGSVNYELAPSSMIQRAVVRMADNFSARAN